MSTFCGLFPFGAKWEKTEMLLLQKQVFEFRVLFDFLLFRISSDFTANYNRGACHLAFYFQIQILNTGAFKVLQYAVKFSWLLPIILGICSPEEHDSKKDLA